MDQAQIEVQVLGSLSQISAAEWDSCACPEAADGGRPLDPFTTHRFLLALESSGSVGRGTGWQPQYLTTYLDGMLIAAAPDVCQIAQPGRVYLRPQLGPCL